MIELISRIADYVMRDSDKLKREVGNVMGGKVLKLQTDYLIEQGKKIGEKQGERRGEKRGEKRGDIARARRTAQNLSEMGLPMEKIAQAVETSTDTVRKWLSAKSASDSAAAGKTL